MAEASPQTSTADSTMNLNQENFVTTGPPSKPTMMGDPQTPEISAFLKRQIQDDRYNAFCIDCQRNRSSHCNISFGTFLCSDCANVHRENFAFHESYIKQVFAESWDTYQIRIVEVGGNKRFFDFLSEYQQERDTIPYKYASVNAHYYRRMISSWARSIRFDEEKPAKNWSEAISRKNEQYQIADKASSAYD